MSRRCTTCLPARCSPMTSSASLWASPTFSTAESLAHVVRVLEKAERARGRISLEAVQIRGKRRQIAKRQRAEFRHMHAGFHSVGLRDPPNERVAAVRKRPRADAKSAADMCEIGTDCAGRSDAANRVAGGAAVRSEGQLAARRFRVWRCLGGLRLMDEPRVELVTLHYDDMKRHQRV